MKQRPAHDQLIQVAPDQLEIRSGGGCVSIFGIPFLAAGLLLMLIGAGVIKPGNSDELQWWVWILLFAMGGVFTAVGGSLFLGRNWKTIDRSRGTISLRWGLLVPMKQTEHSIQEFSAVAIRFVAGDSDSVDQYPVVLEGGLSGTDLKLSTLADYAKAREQAERVAQLLRFPLKDQTTDHELVVNVDTLSRDGRSRVTSMAARLETVSPPPLMRSSVKQGPDGVTIAIPPPGSRVGSLVRVLTPFAIAAFMAAVLLPFFRKTGTPAAIQWIVVGILVLFVVVPLINGVLRATRAGKRGTTVTISPGGILLHEQGFGRAHTTDIRSDTILDIDYSTSESRMQSAKSSAAQRRQAVSPTLPSTEPFQTPSWLGKLNRLIPGKGITVKARTGLYTFAGGLADDEVCYLHYIAVKALFPSSSPVQGGKKEFR